MTKSKDRDWYKEPAKSKDAATGEPEEKKPEGRKERHSREREEAQARHAAAREALHKQHEEEWMALATRQSDEAATPEVSPDVAAAGAPAPVSPETMES